MVRGRDSSLGSKICKGALGGGGRENGLAAAAVGCEGGLEGCCCGIVVGAWVEADSSSDFADDL